ncbi:hypothetical protein U1701_10435 [Sphingomonas sp. PB2P19]
MKVGMIGLAVIVLFIGLASAIIGSATRERPVLTAGAEQSRAVVTAAVTQDNAADRSGEPLAQMGVAPGANTQAQAVQ